MAGRGAYVCQDGDCLTIAINRGALSRALKTPIPAELRSALLTALVPHDDHQGGARGQE